VLRPSLLVVATLIASAGHAQLRVDPQPAVAYDTQQLTVEDCRTTDPSAGDACVASEETPAGDYRSDYLPDYGEVAPVYDAAPNVYLGVSLLPYDYWGWPYYGYWSWPYYGFGYGYAYCCGWPYYGFGWPYYGYAYWGGGYWGGSWHGHGHHDGDHGDWGHHDGGHAGHGSPPAAGAATRTMTAANSPRAGTALDNRSNFASTPAGAARTSAPTNQFSGANRFTGRAPLPSASYYAASRSNVGANPATSAYTSAATNYRGSSSGYAYGRGNAPANARNANDAYRVTSMPSRGYAPSTGRSIARSDGYGAPQRYGGAQTSYAQQHYAPTNRAYANTAMPRGSAARGPMPAYSGARGAMPSYARSGAGSAPRGASHAAAAAPHASGGSYSRGAHGH